MNLLGQAGIDAAHGEILSEEAPNQEQRPEEEKDEQDNDRHQESGGNPIEDVGDDIHINNKF
jgi:hypothetical protein